MLSDSEEDKEILPITKPPYMSDRHFAEFTRYFSQDREFHPRWMYAYYGHLKHKRRVVAVDDKANLLIPRDLDEKKGHKDDLQGVALEAHSIPPASKIVLSYNELVWYAQVRYQSVAFNLLQICS